jgi:hypothetical protein
MVEPLQFYDMRNRQWITCTPSYPHDVKKDGFLLLRRPSVLNCYEFEIHRHQADLKPPHFRDNMAHERASVRTMLVQRKHLDIICESDIEAEKTRLRQKRQRVDAEEAVLSQKRLHIDSDDDPCSSTLSTPVRENTPTAFERSPSIVVSSPRPSAPFHVAQVHGIKLPYVPSSCSRWSEHMYAIDMKDGFALVDSPTMKEHYKKLIDRVAAVFQRPVPETMFYDQRRRWQHTSEKHRRSFVNAGHTQAGLWCNFPK